jgi:hypothetical protein
MHTGNIGLDLVLFLQKYWTHRIVCFDWAKIFAGNCNQVPTQKEQTFDL